MLNSLVNVFVLSRSFSRCDLAKKLNYFVIWKCLLKRRLLWQKDTVPMNDTVASEVLDVLDAENLHVILPVIFQSLGCMPVEVFSLSHNFCLISKRFAKWHVYLDIIIINIWTKTKLSEFLSSLTLKSQTSFFSQSLIEILEYIQGIIGWCHFSPVEFLLLPELD